MFLTTILSFSQDNTTVGDSKIQKNLTIDVATIIISHNKIWNSDICVCVYLQLTMSTTWVIVLLNRAVLVVKGTEKS